MRVYTVHQAATELGVTRQRVHQIARRMKVGRMQGSILIFTNKEVEAMKQRPDWRTEHSGRRKASDG